VVIQWKPTCDLCTLWQRFGRAVRNAALQGIAILIADTKYFDADRDRKAKLAETKKRKAEENVDGEEQPPTKKARVQKTLPVKSVGTSGTTAIPSILVTAADPQRVRALTDEQKQQYEDMRLLYNRRPAAGAQGQQNKVSEPELAMLEFINAKTRPHLPCYRTPIDVCFGNFKLGAICFRVFCLRVDAYLNGSIRPQGVPSRPPYRPALSIFLAPNLL